MSSASTENELFRAVDALLEQVAQSALPVPAERKRLREAAGLSQAQIAAALDARREAVGNWEAGRTEPRPPKRAAYARLLEGPARRFPALADDAPAAASASVVPESVVPESFAPDLCPASAPAPAAVPPSRPKSAASSTARPSTSSRRPATKKAATKKNASAALRATAATGCPSRTCSRRKATRLWTGSHRRLGSSTCRSSMTYADGDTLGEAFTCLPECPAPLVRAEVLHLLWKQQWLTDLSVPLSARSVLRSAS